MAVLDSGGFARAARRLDVSKSIVSRRVARLEADLGAHLLSRTTRGVSATEAGLEFKARAERILRDIADARDAAARHRGEVVGRLRISVPLAFGVQHLAPLFIELASRHPRLEIDASYSDRRVDLIGEGFDAAVRIGDLQDSSLVARRLAPVRAVVIASPGYLGKHGRPTTPSELARHECLIYTGSVDPEWRFRVGKRWISIRPEGRLRSDNSDTILQAAIAGIGIAALPTFLASGAIRSGAVEPILVDYPLPEFGLFVVRPPGREVPGKLRVLIDLLVERFGKEPYWDPCQMVEITPRISDRG